MDEKNVLCAGNAQSMKYYFNEEKFGNLPQAIRDELKIMTVKFLTDAGGAVTFGFNDDHELLITTYETADEIGAEYKIKKLQEEKADLFSRLELYHRTFFS